MTEFDRKEIFEAAYVILAFVSLVYAISPLFGRYRTGYELVGNQVRSVAFILLAHLFLRLGGAL